MLIARLLKSKMPDETICFSFNALLVFQMCSFLIFLLNLCYFIIIILSSFVVMLYFNDNKPNANCAE